MTTTVTIYRLCVDGDMENTLKLVGGGAVSCSVKPTRRRTPTTDA